MTNQDMTPGQIRYSSINDKEQYCSYCGDSLDNKEQCDHDSITQHLSCLECCKYYNIEDYNPYTGELINRLYHS
jgi:uncharacterized protein YbaR (Trm112 family)